MANVGTVTIECPGCGDDLAVPLDALIAERTEDGVVYVQLRADEAELQLQGLACSTTTT